MSGPISAISKRGERHETHLDPAHRCGRAVRCAAAVSYTHLQGAADGYPLLLPTGKLAWQMLPTVFQIQHGQQFLDVYKRQGLGKGAV